MKQIKLNDTVNSQLDSLAAKRKKDYDLIRTKVGIVEQLINAAYKKEVGVNK